LKLPARIYRTLTMAQPTPHQNDVSAEELDTILLGWRQKLVKPTRAVLIVTLADASDRVEGTHLHMGKPRGLPGCHDPIFAENVRRLWKRYDTTGVIPVIVHRRDGPVPFVGLKIAGLPWAAAEGDWCGGCGRRYSEGHKC
jgi:hypothetical protein